MLVEVLLHCFKGTLGRGFLQGTPQWLSSHLTLERREILLHIALALALLVLNNVAFDDSEISIT
jgi:hypothetical protein